MQLFSADARVFSKKFFDLEKVKKRASKVAHNGPRPFYFTVQPRPQPTAQNWFFILWNLGTRHLFSYLWLKPFLVYPTVFWINMTQKERWGSNYALICLLHMDYLEECSKITTYWAKKHKTASIFSEMLHLNTILARWFTIFDPIQTLQGAV